jgi:TipAS antibiotic-recognition domain
VRELDPNAQHGSMYQNNYSQEQNNRFAAEFGAITEAFNQAQVAGTAPDSPEVQALVAKHYEFISQFWKPSRAAYKSLAQSYILPTGYRDTYEAVNPGLAKFHYDAIVIWADANLE